MVKFMTGEWAKEYCKALNDSKAYEIAGKGWEGDFVFLAEYPDGKVTKLYIDLFDGKCRKAYEMKETEDIQAAFIMS
ncbi:MAG: sterol carrier protein, partial [Promethearchaeota archaeon]